MEKARRMEKKTIRLGDIPPQPLLAKLTHISFSTPQKNMNVFKYIKSVQENLIFLQNEKIKLMQKYGDPQEDGSYLITKPNVDKFKEEMSAIFDLDITESIYPHGLTEEDFTDEKCSYPEDKTFWLNSSDIAVLLE